MATFCYHTSSRIVGGSCGFGCYPSDEEEQGLLEAGWELFIVDEEEFIPETRQTILHRAWLARKPAIVQDSPIAFSKIFGSVDNDRRM